MKFLLTRFFLLAILRRISVNGVNPMRSAIIHGAYPTLIIKQYHLAQAYHSIIFC